MSESSFSPAAHVRRWEGESGQECTSLSVSVISPAETVWQCDSAWAVTVWAHDSCHAQEVTAAREPVQGLDPGVDGEMAQDAATPCVLIRAGSACCAVLEYPQFICCTLRCSQRGPLCLFHLCICHPSYEHSRRSAEPK